MKNFSVTKLTLTFLITLFSVMMMSGCSALMKDEASLETTKIKSENSTLEIAVPFALEDEEVNINDFGAVAPYVKDYSMKTGEEGGITIMISDYVFYKEKIESDTGMPFEPDLEGALHGAVGNVKNVENAGVVKDIEINGMRGKEINGTLKLKFKGDSSPSDGEFRMITFSKGPEMWMIGVIYKPSDDNLKISDMIFNSIKIR